jgi:hypothetical protein
MNQMLWLRITVTFIDLFLSVERGDYNLNPEHQRDVVHDDTWQSGIINSALGIDDIPQVYFHTTILEDGSSTRESLDGKQRCMSIVRYLENKYIFNPITIIKEENESLVGKLYSELSPVEKQKIDRCTIDCKIYTQTLTPIEIGEFFLQRQECKKTSFGEQLKAQLQSGVKVQIEMIMLNGEYKIALCNVKKVGNRSEQLAHVGRMLYAYIHKYDEETRKGLDETPVKVVKWWIEQPELEEQDLADFREISYKALEYSNTYSGVQRWSKGSKAILITLFAILDDFCWDKETHSWNNENLERLTETLQNQEEILSEVGGTHFAARRHREILKDKVGF